MKTSRIVLIAALFFVPAAALAKTAGESSIVSGEPQAARRVVLERAASINQERLRQASVHAELMRGVGERVKENLSAHIESMGISEVVPVVTPLPRATAPFSSVSRGTCAQACTSLRGMVPDA